MLAKLILYSLLTQFNLHPQLTLQNLSGGTRFKCYPGPFSSVSYIISNDIYGIDLATAYFVFCSSYNFRGAVLTNQRLYEMAARGLCVAVGVRSIPREYEFICKVFYPEDFP